MKLHKGRRDLHLKHSAKEWRDILGWTPLHYAFRLGDLEATKKLCDLYGDQEVKLLTDFASLLCL